MKSGEQHSATSIIFDIEMSTQTCFVELFYSIRNFLQLLLTYVNQNLRTIKFHACLFPQCASSKYELRIAKKS